ncbi:hypothetical protein EG68_00324 [Paragonimus skrjabini miyazakii]|uniref:Uncharacterized protein n=1 Tax=Paragonimus skrjabini miyazakii TaxID=59628 RepID=A0A8S9Z6D7_9TREM|nr:hypothetical protein EG68_00324 [Paragonimus skrjabini miyazakii]
MFKQKAFKFTILTPWTLLSEKLPAEVCQDEPADEFADLLCVRTRLELNRYAFWPRARGEAFLYSSFDAFEERFLRHSEYAVIVLSGKNTSCLDSIYPRLLVFFTMRPSWAKRFLLVFLGEPEARFRFDTGLLSHAPIVFHGTADTNWTTDDECWERLLGVLRTDYVPASSEDLTTRDRFGSRTRIGNKWMSITDLRGRQFAIKITERATQVDLIPSSWHNLTSCGRSTPLSNRQPGFTTNYLSPPISGCFRVQSENDFPRPTKSQLIGSDYMDSSVESLELRRNRSLSLPPISTKRFSSQSSHVFYGSSPGLNPELSPCIRRLILSGPGGHTTAIEEREEEINANHSDEESDSGHNDDMCLRISGLVISKKGKATKRLRSYDRTLDKNGSPTVSGEHGLLDTKQSHDIWLRRKRKSQSTDELSTNERGRVSMKERIKKRASELLQPKRNKFSKNPKITLGNTLKSLANVSADILSVNPRQEGTTVRDDHSGTVIHVPAVHLSTNVRLQREDENTTDKDRLPRMPILHVSDNSTVVSGDHLKQMTEDHESVSSLFNKRDEHLERDPYAASQLCTGRTNVNSEGSHVDANILREDERQEIIKPELRQHSSCIPPNHAEYLPQSQVPVKIPFEHNSPPVISPDRNKEGSSSTGLEAVNNRAVTEYQLEVIQREAVNKDRSIPNFIAIPSEGTTEPKTSGTFSTALTQYTDTETQELMGKPGSFPTSLEPDSMITLDVTGNRKDSTRSTKDNVEQSSEIDAHESRGRSTSVFGLDKVYSKEYYTDDNLSNTGLSGFSMVPPASVSTETSSESEEGKIVEASPLKLMTSESPDCRLAPLSSSLHEEYKQKAHETNVTHVLNSAIPNVSLEMSKQTSITQHQIESCDNDPQSTHPIQSNLNSNKLNSPPFKSACTMEMAKPNDLVFVGELHVGDHVSQALFDLDSQADEQISKWSEMYGQYNTVTALPKPCVLSQAETRRCSDLEFIRSGFDTQTGLHSQPTLVSSEDHCNTEFVVSSGKDTQSLQMASPYNTIDPKHQGTSSQPTLQSKTLADSDLAVTSLKNPLLYADHNANRYPTDKIDSTVSDLIMDVDSGLEVESSALSSFTEEPNGISWSSPTDVLQSLPKGSSNLTSPDRTQPTSPNWSSKDSDNSEITTISRPVSIHHISLVTASTEKMKGSEREYPSNQTSTSAFEAFNNLDPAAIKNEENLSKKPELQGSQGLVESSVAKKMESTELIYETVQPPPASGHDKLGTMQPERTFTNDILPSNNTRQGISQNVEFTELAANTSSSWTGWLKSKIFGENCEDGPETQPETKVQAIPSPFFPKRLRTTDEDSSGPTILSDSYQNKMTTGDAIFPKTSRKLLLEEDSLVKKDVSHELSESLIEPTVIRTQAAVLQQPGGSLAVQTGVTSVCTVPTNQSVTYSTTNNLVKDSYQNSEGSSPQAEDQQAETTTGSWSSWIPSGFLFWNNESEKEIPETVLPERSNELRLAASDQNLMCDRQQVAEGEEFSELEVKNKTLGLNPEAAERMIVSGKSTANQQEDTDFVPDLPQNSPVYGDAVPQTVMTYTSVNPAQTNASSSGSDVQVARVSTTREHGQHSLWSLRTFSSVFNFATLYIPRHIYWFYVATNESQERLLDAMAERSLHLAITWNSFQDGLRNPLCVAVIFIGFTTVSPYVRQWPLIAANLIEYTNVYMFVPPFWVDRPILSHLDYLIHSARRSLRWNGRTRVTSFSNRPWSLANPVD